MTRWLLVACALVACADRKPGGGASGGAGGRPAPRFPVEVAPVEARRVEYVLDAVGTVDAHERVQVTARVAGVVERVRFREGDRVGDGRVLAEIEPDRFRVAVTSARAALERAEAGLADARAALERREAAESRSPGVIAREEIESARTRARVGAAEVAQARAALEAARLNLRDAIVRSPVGGTIETRTVSTGQFVQAGTVLATLVRRDPLLLRFQVPEAEAARLSRGMRALFRVRGQAQAMEATLTHVAQAADAASRMVQVLAEVRGPGAEALRPGTFAEVSVPVGAAAEAPVIPQVAVRPTEKGFVAFVVEEDTARERTLTLGLRTADGLVEVKAGLRRGETLVIRGAEALHDGARVRVEAPRPGKQPEADAGRPAAKG